MQRWKLSCKTQNFLHDVIERNMKFEQEDREHIQRSDVAVNTCISFRLAFVVNAIIYVWVEHIYRFFFQMRTFFLCLRYTRTDVGCLYVYTYKTRSHKYLNTHEHTCTIHKTISDDHALFCHAIYTPPSSHTHTHTTLRWLIDIGHFNSNSSAI